MLAISKVGGLPSELLISISAVSGAALGFASQKTRGNFIAGLYLLPVRPFKVGNYVKIGTVEGIAQDNNTPKKSVHMQNRTPKTS